LWYNAAMNRTQLLYIAVPLLFLLFLFFSRDRGEEQRRREAAHPSDLVGRIMEHNTKSDMFSGGGSGNYGGTDGNNAFMDANPRPARPSAQPPSRPQGDNYYPPRPTDPKAPKPESWNGTIPKGIRPFFLPNGRPITFVGEKVYSVNEKGLGKPLPDGMYPLYGGKYMMVVRDGKKVID